MGVIGCLGLHRAGLSLPLLDTHQGHLEATAIDPGRPAEGYGDAIFILCRQPAHKGTVGGPQSGATSRGKHRALAQWVATGRT